MQRRGHRTLCPNPIVASKVFFIAFAFASLIFFAPDATANPSYVSCPGGFIARTLRDCPVITIHRPPVTVGQGGGGSRGLLGGLLGGLGL